MDLKSFQFQSAVEVFLLSPEKDEVLLLHRDKNKDYLPNYYAGIGGKMDLEDIEMPIDTAIREMKEESGYKINELEELKLKAIVTVKDRYGKWIIFDFVGVVKEKKFKNKKKIEEGVLEWVKINRVCRLNLIQDLRDGILERILNTKNLLWIQSEYDESDKLIKIKIK